MQQNGAAAARKRRERALRAAAEQAARVDRAKRRLVELEQEKERRAKAAAEKSAPRVSVSDPDVRLMRMADGSFVMLSPRCGPLDARQTLREIRLG